MTWLTVQESASLCGVTESAIKKAAKQNRYQSCHVEGVGRGGKQLRIALESLPEEAQARYSGEPETTSAEALLSLTDAQRDIVFAKQTIVLSYQDFKIVLAFQGLEQSILDSIKQDSNLADRFKELLHEAKAKIESDED